MVGPMLLLKMLHCRRMNGRNMNSGDEMGDEGNSNNENSTESNIKMEQNDDSTCRVCLKEGCIPIFGNETLEDVSDSLNIFASLEVTVDDPYPKYLCQPCNELLQGAILFRKTAQQSDHLLKNPVEDSHASGIDDSYDYANDDDNLSDYEDRKPKKQRSYHCKKCEISFDSFKEFNDHKLTEEHENMRLVCPVCNRSYTALYLKKHLAIHKQETPFMCDICGKNFSMQGPFTRHRLTHFYKLPFNCSLCPYKGRFRESLKMHMRTHTGEKPYQCSQCPSRFINKSNLNKHIKTHKGQHDFKCESCNRGFYTKRELELHYKVDHSGIKEHVCNICGKAFGYRKQMMKHQLKVHKRAKLRSGRMPLYLKVETMKQQGQHISTES
ncbi:gastrula zinc finger protein XlCGF17.1-like [Spodoptera litura]|uniref:Gastrula zinc finger protein XlCGF17.1-like n=1 Tax=Spodoptera litura TaxID=69820 RepID=A0A9J7EFN4_SPOLT|nr:gastrula zinc finger protein XlCGF17.1-like [Spodoptera litura]